MTWRIRPLIIHICLAFLIPGCISQLTAASSKNMFTHSSRTIFPQDNVTYARSTRFLFDCWKMQKHNFTTIVHENTVMQQCAYPPEWNKHRSETKKICFQMLNNKYFSHAAHFHQYFSIVHVTSIVVCLWSLFWNEIFLPNTALETEL